MGAGNREAAARTVETIEALGLPLVVIYAPTWFRASDLSSMKEEGRIIGAMFGMEDKAAALMDRLAATERLIRERTRDIPEAEKPRVLYMGLNPDIRKQGGAGTAHGVDTPESYIIENVAGAKNAFTGTGAGVPMSAEQMYALDPGRHSAAHLQRLPSSPRADGSAVFQKSARTAGRAGKKGLRHAVVAHELRAPRGIPPGHADCGQGRLSGPLQGYQRI